MTEYLVHKEPLDKRTGSGLSLNQRLDFKDNRENQKQVKELMLQFKTKKTIQLSDPPGKRQSPRLIGRAPVDYSAGLEPDDAARQLDTRDPAYHISCRSMLFGGFEDGVREEVYRRFSVLGPVVCQNPGCGKALTLGTMSVDHIESCSAYFNREGYLKTRAQRDVWYNMYSNLQPMCGPCNSSKSGPQYELRKVTAALTRG